MFNCSNIIIVLLYSFVLFKVLKKEQKTEMLLLTFITFCILRTSKLGLSRSTRPEGFEDSETNQLNPNKSKVNPVNISSNQVTEEGGKILKPSLPSELNMGPYDGICLKTGNQDYWMKSPDNTSLLSNEDLYSYLGSQGPVKMRLSDQSDLVGPPIDGVKGSATKQFMFANNKTSPLCCPSSFSTSTGCLCTTENQRDFIAARGVLGENPGREIKDNEF